ncbi:MAG: GTP cyclohydrolase I FolE [Pseudomonadota bacterium]|nr:GTP cyclohydrolase I FolE [Pseudomonadota bacterium]
MVDKKNKSFSRDEAQEALRVLLSWIGEDPQRKGLLKTPDRVLKSFEDWFSGYKADPVEILGSSFPDADGYDEMAVLTDIDFESHCEHHMAPFIGRAHVAYIPNKKVVGISKIVRMINAYSKRLQIQEKLTVQIARCLNDVLKPTGVAVVLEAKHECMTTRGVYKPNIKMTTSAMFGSFRTNHSTRSEFLSMIKKS